VLWDERADIVRTATVHDVPSALAGRAIRDRVVVAAMWLKATTSVTSAPAQRFAPLRHAFDGPAPPLVVLTNARVDEAQPWIEALARLWGRDPVVLGADELGALVDASPATRRRVPSVLGVRDLDPLLDGAGSWDEAAARELARVFVPTRAYRHTLETLERHRFAVLTGPPEMGKTAIARMLGLALATEGWEVHECIRPDQVWDAFEPRRAQLFVADDAFGSTEYRPDTAERWALDLDRILRRLDERHWLVWTSRPAPLKAGLGRIHREHGVERFPQPAEVHVDASALDVEEKTLILFRHARAADDLGRLAIDIVRDYGPRIVEHPHFTPGRIGRFVQTRLPLLAAGDLRDQAYLRGRPGALRAAIEAEIAEPTIAMAESYRALCPEHRALLLALVDQPPGPVGERELFTTARRHSPEGLPRSPVDLLDRLTDHFVRVVPPATVTWVHPSWRDLVIEELAADPAARRNFVERCSVDGLLLALSHAGGRHGARAQPLLVDDADWDGAAQRIHELVPALDEPQLLALLASLAAAIGSADARTAAELQALAATALQRVTSLWRSGAWAPDGPLLDSWLRLSAHVPEMPPGPELELMWQRVIPPATTPYSIAEAERYARWLRVARSLVRRSSDPAGWLGFPDAYGRELDALLDLDPEHAAVAESGTLRALLNECLGLVAALVPDRAYRSTALAWVLRTYERPEPLSEAPPVIYRPPTPPSIVRRILADLG
jgi:hypothetical protein